MPPLRRCHWLRICLVCLGLCAASFALALPDDPGVDGIWQSGATVAHPDGALSLGRNPAGLGGTAGADGRLLWASGGHGAGVGGFVSAPWGPLAVGLGGEWPQAGSSWRGGLGASWQAAESVAVGLSWQQRRGGTLTDQTWHLGGLWRPTSWLSVGGRITDVDANGNDLRLTAGLGLRWPGSIRLTCSGEIESSLDRLAWRQFRLATHWQIVPGLQLIGDWQRSQAAEGGTDEQRLGVSMRFGFGAMGVGVGSRLDATPDGAWTPHLIGDLRVSQDAPPSLVDSEPAALRIRLAGELSEHDDGGEHPVFTHLVLQLQRLRDVHTVRLIVFEVRQLSLDWAQVEELRALFAQLRKAGKALVWSGEDLGVRNLMLAVACDRIVMPASGTVSARGLSVDFLSLREALERLGVVVQTVRYREHKTAPEPLTRDEPSTELQAQIEAQLQHHWHAFEEAVALGRQVSPSALEAAMSAGVVFPADAKAAGLIDAVLDEQQLEPQLRAWRLLEADETLETWQPMAVRRQTWGAQRRIAVVALDGGISDHGGVGLTGATVGGVELAKQLRALGRDPQVEGVVMRIRSPGGTLLGSDAMRDALAELSRHVPVAASMGGVAASGGYWTALGAPTVFADRATLTGSIGAFVLKPTLSGLLDQLHVHHRAFDIGPHAGVTSPWRPWSDADESAAHRSLGRYYDLFLQRTAQARKLELTTVGNLAGGRIWFGDEALQHGLVDRQGGVLDAVAHVRGAAGLAGDDDVRVEVLPKPSLRQRLWRQLGLPLGQAPSPLLQAFALAVGPWLDLPTLSLWLGDAGPMVVLPVHAAAPGP